ncbi:amino acid ABC transporter permease [Streptomyces sp. NPDC005890]|uniref:amino acid ABC transporter permease n=1 Tax=Streptomyces sp. NPDC005890 TaxID=3154568 RepID=UPI0033C84C47
MTEASALYDVPGPRSRRRHTAYGLLSTVVLVTLVAWLLSLLFDTGQFTHTKWMPGVLATGRLSDHRPVCLLATLVVEFFRAMPVLVMIFFVFVALKMQPLPALVAGLTLYNGSVLAEVFRSGVNAVERGQREAAFALGMRKTQVMLHVLVPQAVRAMLPAIISQLVVALKDTSLGFLITYEEFLHAGKLIASDLDYDLPFIPVVMVISPIYIGMCMLLSWFADWVSRRERRSPKTKGVAVATPGPGALLPGGVPPTAPRP